MRILALPRYDRLGASSRLRFLDFLPGLAATGIALRVSPFFDDAYLRRQYAGLRPDRRAVAGHYARRFTALAGRRGHDLLWIEKEALPFLPLAVERAALSGVPYVLDFDDAWHERYEGHPNPAVRRLLGGKLARLAGAAAAVLVGNGHLEDWAWRAGARRVVRLPTPVDLARYPDRPPPTDGFRLGWIGTPSSAVHLALLAEPLRRLAAEGPLTLVTIGVAPVALPGVPEEFHPWTSETEGALLATIHAGIMPLADTPFTRGKSGYKLIQYMAAGRAAIGSPVGENALIVRPEETGLLPGTEGEWLDALRRLRADPGFAARLGRAGRVEAATRFGLAVLVPRLAETLRCAAEGERG
ncbi:glycosyltransferase family 4 protein [Rhodospirillum centenum]|uniref:Glycosyl transferase family protein n=1 Tax=Rhodospirillum centenum (strain ATCC 51521 / SW) TaxID=414684 RepID=B6IQ82_RHOCS|nr:glycosyltransferase family 4 protein [Rhodospirillum centenum]ACI97618.1 glycosyl transferase family protein [Rhodospirillum centenum SW]